MPQFFPDFCLKEGKNSSHIYFNLISYRHKSMHKQDTIVPIFSSQAEKFLSLVSKVFLDVIKFI